MGAVLTSSSFLAPRAASAQGLGCHGAFASAGAPEGDMYNAVMVLNRSHLSCVSALRIGAEGRALNGLKPVFGPQFGGGGFGGPFHVRDYHCYLLNRGSDFINATCRRGRRWVRFYDHRQYWSIPTPGWP
ncbi:MAG TPA: hypothetical protein VII01_18210 [Solirubrobacteraceae bacterium]